MKTALALVMILVILALPVPAFAYKHHSHVQGALIGAAAGALLGHNVKSAAIGAAVGTGVQALRNREEERRAYSRHRHYYRTHTTRYYRTYNHY
jgi:hypothetical protein